MTKAVKPKNVTLEEAHREWMKSWRFRFWYYAYTPRFWIVRQVIRFRIWRRRGG